MCADGTEKRGGTIKRQTTFLHRFFAKQLSLKLVKTAELDPQQRFLFGLHPHGILPFGGIMNVLHSLLDKP